MRMERRQNGYKRFEKANRPPPDMPWVWFTREMLESEAWRAMTLPARRVLDRLMIEHMSHAGTMNGELPCTYDDFQRVWDENDRQAIQRAATKLLDDWQLRVMRDGVDPLVAGRMQADDLPVTLAERSPAHVRR